MPAYLAKRFVYSLFVLFGASVVVFLGMRLVPGDPATAVLGPSATAEEIAHFHAAHGLDRPFLVQFGRFIADAATLDFGDSFRLDGSATSLVGAYLPATAALAFAAFALAVVLSVPLGIWTALRPDGPADRVISLLSMTGQAVPTFWVGIMLVLLFSRTLHWLPSSGAASTSAMVLPAVTLALPLLSLLVRLVRSGLLEVLGEGYVETARAKGLSEWRVVGRHAVRTMLIPVVTVAGLELGQLLGGAVVIETVFAWPGLGRLLITAIDYRDYAVVQACVLLLAAGFVLINLVVDLLYGYLDPRVRVAT